MNFSDEYDIEKTVAEGHFAKIFLTKHKITQTNVILKAVHKELTSLNQFIKEFHYNYQLSHHPCILSCYQVRSLRLWNYFCHKLLNLNLSKENTQNYFQLFYDRGKEIQSNFYSLIGPLNYLEVFQLFN